MIRQETLRDGRHHSGRRLLRLVAASGALLMLLASSLPGLAGAQASPDGSGAAAAQPTENDDLLQITSVTPWVTPDGEFQVQFAPTSSIPAGATLAYAVYQALKPTNAETLRDEVNAVIDGGRPGKYLRGWTTAPLTDYGDPATGSLLTIPIRSGRAQDSSRAFLPNPGIHPVEVVLNDSDGSALWSDVVFLNRLPSDYVPGTAATDTTAATPAPAGSHPSVAVTLMLPVESAPTVAADGSASFSIEERTALDGVDALLSDVPGAPLTLAVRPNTLDGLSRVTDRWAQHLIETISGALADAGDGTTDRAGARLLALPYVSVDTGGLIAADAADDLTRQLALGGQVSTELLGRRGVGTTWTMDETLTRASLPWLASHGADTVVLPSSALERPGAVSEQRTMTAGVQLEEGSGVRAIAYDSVLSQRLSDSSVEPGVRAHQAVAVMMAAWFASPTSAEAPPASVILLPPSIDADVINALTPSLDGSGPLVADVTAPVLPPASADSQEPTVALVPTTPPDERTSVADAAETRLQIEAYRSMVGTADPILDLWDRLNAETLSADLPAPQRLALHNSVRTQIAADVGAIQPPRERRVVVTSRDANIPLRISNGLPYDVHLILRARSPRLDIDGGDSRSIVLQPGENRIDLPVTVQAPGESLMRIELLSPDEQLLVATLDVPVRSTAISGVGAALSIISVLFLLAWWVHTHRRKQREAARIGGGHPCAPSETSSDPAAPSDVDTTAVTGAEEQQIPAPAGVAPDPSSTNDDPHTDSVT